MWELLPSVIRPSTLAIIALEQNTLIFRENKMLTSKKEMGVERGDVREF